MLLAFRIRLSVFRLLIQPSTILLRKAHCTMFSRSLHCQIIVGVYQSLKTITLEKLRSVLCASVGGIGEIRVFQISVRLVLRWTPGSCVCRCELQAMTFGIFWRCNGAKRLCRLLPRWPFRSSMKVKSVIACRYRQYWARQRYFKSQFCMRHNLLAGGHSLEMISIMLADFRCFYPFLPPWWDE